MIPFSIAFAGKSNSGKTELISKLVRLFKDKGLKVGNVKRCSQGFDLDKEGKDSWRYKDSGSQGVLMIAPNEIALIKDIEQIELDDAVDSYLSAYDIVLIEGYKEIKNLRKIAVLRKDYHEELPPESAGYIAIVADFPVESKLPVFEYQNIQGIFDFIMGLYEKNDDRSYIEVNGKKVPVNSFVKNIIMQINLAAIKTLKLKDSEIKEIKVVVKPEDVKKFEA